MATKVNSGGLRCRGNGRLSTPVCFIPPPALCRQYRVRQLSCSATHVVTSTSAYRSPTRVPYSVTFVRGSHVTVSSISCMSCTILWRRVNGRITDRSPLTAIGLGPASPDHATVIDSAVKLLQKRPEHYLYASTCVHALQRLLASAAVLPLEYGIPVTF